MNSIAHKKIKLFILAIIILIMLCLVFINHYSKRVYVNIENNDKIEEVIISDIPEVKEEIIADNSIKKEKRKSKVNLDNIDVIVKVNNNETEKYLVSVNDVIDIEVNNLNKKYVLYYSLRNEEFNTEYKLYDKNFLNSIETPSKFNLYIKIVVDNIYKEYFVGEFQVYDIVYEHANEVDKNIEIGTIYNEDGTTYTNEDNSEYLYDDVDINKNIVINNIDQETVEETTTVINTDEASEEEKAVLNGNVYVVEETNLNEVDITGYLYIDTEENVTIDENILTDSNIYSITIKNNDFTINEQCYHYETVENEIILNNSNNEQIEIDSILTNSKAEVNENNELIIIKDESDSSFNLMENSKSSLLRL